MLNTGLPDPAIPDSLRQSGSQAERQPDMSIRHQQPANHSPVIGGSAGLPFGVSATAEELQCSLRQLSTGSGMSKVHEPNSRKPDVFISSLRSPESILIPSIDMSTLIWGEATQPSSAYTYNKAPIIPLAHIKAGLRETDPEQLGGWSGAQERYERRLSPK